MTSGSKNVSEEGSLQASSSSPGERVIQGFALRYGLSAREREVCLLLGRGQAAKEIAASLQLSAKTVSTYLQRICWKLACQDREKLRGMLFEFACAGWERLQPGDGDVGLEDDT